MFDHRVGPERTAPSATRERDIERLAGLARDRSASLMSGSGASC
jgi:hypothetical protein